MIHSSVPGSASPRSIGAGGRWKQPAATFKRELLQFAHKKLKRPPKFGEDIIYTNSGDGRHFVSEVTLQWPERAPQVFKGGSQMRIKPTYQFAVKTALVALLPGESVGIGVGIGDQNVPPDFIA
uniref:Uncharacterized protein n=1 Tax=Pyrodinium bahamense TaxID=73915 RepID=A0A7S0BBS3_9DINO|mmetsp:Transcript_771/g.2110  ORF Transcript_771/g.2110 Transcript_771/m.2110 type:complete len:124 (+) Transcript_771:161-532(+)